MVGETCSWCGCLCDRWYVDEYGTVICVDCSHIFLSRSRDLSWERREVTGDNYDEDTYRDYRG